PAALDELDELVVARRQVAAEAVPLIGRVDRDGAHGLGGRGGRERDGCGHARAEQRQLSGSRQDGHEAWTAAALRREGGQYSTATRLCHTRCSAEAASTPNSGRFLQSLDQRFHHVVTGRRLHAVFT